MTLWQTIASAFLLLAVYIIIAIRCENRRVRGTAPRPIAPRRARCR